MNKPIIKVLVGLPGSGKSTYVKAYLKYHPNTVVISTDDIIEEYARTLGKTYSEIFKEVIGDATEQVNLKFKEAVDNKLDIIYDQTNLSAKKRKIILNKAPGYYSIAVKFWIPMPQLYLRLQKRAEETGKVIPVNIIEDMKKRFESPTFDEGFDEIHFEIGENLC